ncbi:MAG TPA: hypothetical protein VG248_09555 [Caulobacteraceae bacterium]|jgi:hypothetical protein|nr:hypothetical protein [Caulobacteraceae bacterium]
MASPSPDAEHQLQRLDAQLRAEPSASLVLTTWCRERGLMGPADTLRAIASDQTGPEPASLRRDLRIGPGQSVRRRHVQLLCGEHVVSQADNFYLPGRLTPAMNHDLETTGHPFGIVVRDLHFTRRRLEAGTPPSAAACLAGKGVGAAGAVLRHRALLTGADGSPFSEVVETYQCAVLSGARPRAASR